MYARHISIGVFSLHVNGKFGGSYQDDFNLWGNSALANNKGSGNKLLDVIKSVRVNLL